MLLINTKKNLKPIELLVYLIYIKKGLFDHVRFSLSDNSSISHKKIDFLNVWKFCVIISCVPLMGRQPILLQPNKLQTYPQT